MISDNLIHIARQIRANQKSVDAWEAAHRKKTQPPFYCSMDLRDSGHKIVPVDSNLFPAGFNNICPADLRAAPSIIRRHIESHAHKAPIKRVLILPESHTHNTFYLENLYYLNHMIENAGFESRIGWYGDLPDGKGETFELTSHSGKEIRFHKISIDKDRLLSGSFVPDLILLNNDFSSGYPHELDNVVQPIVPSHKLGWHSRKKSDHFAHYNRLAAEFASIINIDPWLIQVMSEEVSPVDFGESIGIDEVCASVDRVLLATQKAYDSRHIERKPFVFVKHNAGTYGMGIMVVTSSDDIRNMNRREKNKMNVGKNNLHIDSVVVQEGVPSALTTNNIVAEPVIYLVAWDLVGGFLRTNSKRGDGDNLNSQGMIFEKLCLSDFRNENGRERELVYGTIAKISALATGFEIVDKT